MSCSIVENYVFYVSMWLKKNHTLVISKRRNEFIKQPFHKAFIFRNNFC